MKFFISNSEASVKESSAAAIVKANSIPPYQDNEVPDDDMQEPQIKGALQELMALKGVGPATATLTIIMPRSWLFIDR
jgi:endonuclease III